MLQILKKNNFITDTLFSDICSKNFLENEIKKFDNIAKDLFDNYSESNGSNIKLSCSSGTPIPPSLNKIFIKSSFVYTCIDIGE